MPRILLLAAWAAALPVVAGAASFQLDISGDRNVPTFLITNTSASDEITDFVFTIKDPEFAFDFYENVVGPDIASFAFDNLSFGRGQGTSNADGEVNPSLDIAFTGFDAGETFQFDADVDEGPASMGSQNFESVFFNNGADPSAMILVMFGSGASAMVTLPDELPSQANYSFSASADVPVPASLPLLAAAIAGLGFAARRR